MVSTKTKTKVAKVVSTLILTLPAISVWLQFPTNVARDVWYYSERFMATHIIQTGHIFSQDTLGVQVAGQDVFRFWGKIGTEQTLPMMSIFKAVLSIVTGVELKYWNILMPGYVLVFLSLIVLLQYTDVPFYIILLIAAIGAIIPNKPVINFLMSKTLIEAISLLALFPLFHFTRVRKSKGPLIQHLILSTIFAFFLYFQDPGGWGRVVSTYIVVVLMSYVLADRVPRLLGLFVAMVYLGPSIFSLSYGFQAVSSIRNLIYLDIDNPFGTTTASANPYLLVSENYGLWVAIAILIPAIVGGVYYLMKIKTRLNQADSSRQPFDVDIVLVGWGVVLSLFTVLYLTAGEYFLIIRAYKIGTPLFIISGAVGLIAVSNRLKVPPSVPTGLLVSVFVVVFILQSSVAHGHVNTYQPGTQAWADHVREFDSGLLVGDMKMGSALVANSVFGYHYPREVDEIGTMFYSINQTSYCSYLGDVEADSLVMYRSMTDEGLYSGSFTLKPISEHSYEMKSHALDKRYTNGEVETFSPECY